MKNKILKVLVLILFVVAIALSAKYYYSYFNDATTPAETINNDSLQDDILATHQNIWVNNGDGKFPSQGEKCLACHQGIEPPRPFGSLMMQQIFKRGEQMGDPNGCVVCHGGTPDETTNKDLAHKGVPLGSLLSDFTPVPAALQVNESTCGTCHKEHTYSVQRSIMNTDAGKMKAITHSFGIGTDNKDHIFSDHDIDDPDGQKPLFGTDTYIAYMKDMADKFPGQYPKELKQIPEVKLEDLAKMPHQAAFTYLRNCNACHLSNKGMQDRGHFRGMGCAACHNLYSNEGFYEGSDPSILKDEPGHVLTHAMQGTRKSGTNINGHELAGGIQVSTCAACHAAGRRIGHAYQGLMALERSDGKGPFDEDGMPQKTNAGYVFKHMRDDAHHRISLDGKTVTGLLCQDCHTTNSMHGNGNIGATTLATIEVECADCHGTPTHYPWELPIGYGDEFGKTLDMSKGRGLSDNVLDVTKKFGITYPKDDGYLLSSRGNPFGNIVRRGNKVIVHSDSGHDFEVPLLKTLTQNKAFKHNDKAFTAMVGIDAHMQKLECYACHSTWVPQYYGYKFVMDYSQKSIDWLKSPEKVNKDGTTADYHKNYVMQDGASTRGDYSHIRWENSPLGINGEGRVSPLVGVIQSVYTVIDKDGNVIAYNKTGKRQDGINSMELAPLNPHTTSLQSRDCMDCHGNKTAMGLGIDSGVYDANPQDPKYADVIDKDGNNVSHFTKAQISAIKQLHGDFMQLINEDGKQVQTIDTHWPTSMPLTKEQRDKLSRNNTCTACHQDMPNGSIPIKMLVKVAEIANLSFETEEAHGALLHENNILISWVKAIGIILGILSIPVAFIVFIKRKAMKNFLLHFITFLKDYFRSQKGGR